MKPLPIGIQDFNKVIQGGYLYVDKTELIFNLIANNAACFLSRPRRFGKSLLISTLEEIFSGNRELFKGLWIDEQSQYDWLKHPVIRIDFSKIPSGDEETLSRGLNERLTELSNFYEVSIERDLNVSIYLNRLIMGLHSKFKSKVVILIDEYDSPIISNINNAEVAAANRKLLAEFYRTIKASDEYLRFMFLTGVSKFAKVSVFSGLNNLVDITLDAEYSTLLGYTQEELESYFGEGIDLITTLLKTERSALLENVRRWYNGYRFSRAETKVYNPFSVLLFFSKKEFDNYWFETGTPTFLIDLIGKNDYDLRLIHEREISSRGFNRYEIDNIPILPVLFNTGYLTISQVERPDITQTDFILNYPNNEVRISFLEQFIDSAFSEGTTARSYTRKLTKSIRADNLEQVIAIIKTFFAEIPYDLKSANCHSEAYYQSLVYCIFKLVGYDTSAEERTNKGRIDLVVEGNQSIYLFEMKVDKPAQEAIEQIKSRGYADKYRLSNKKLTLVGLSFSRAERNIADYAVEEI